MLRFFLSILVLSQYMFPKFLIFIPSFSSVFNKEKHCLVGRFVVRVHVEKPTHFALFLESLHFLGAQSRVLSLLSAATVAGIGPNLLFERPPPFSFSSSSYECLDVFFRF